ncbi:hypothetical protein NDU88_003533 [Pleurodeles waltl]|uniref:Uncharacterized protein n=1 Tax=Pleurodeles waltl TaxID=8319 RepID=A0AAV7TQ23_PLEWA|nr:hypothetical protein NDU88_003533 [Pleurodeles waltl]
MHSIFMVIARVSFGPRVRLPEEAWRRVKAVNRSAAALPPGSTLGFTVQNKYILLSDYQAPPTVLSGLYDDT